MDKRKVILNKRRIVDWICNAVILCGVLVVLYWVAQVTSTCSFHTPSESMTPTLLPDESGLVNKWKMGARIFNFFDAVKGKPYEIKRLPGYGRLERGDVIVFNYRRYIEWETSLNSYGTTQWPSWTVNRSGDIASEKTTASPPATMS